MGRGPERRHAFLVRWGEAVEAWRAAVMEPPLWNEGASPFPHEREALAFLKARLPNNEPTNVEFIADHGSVNEVDVLVVTPRGFFLVEIKSFPGILFGDGQNRRWRRPNGSEKALPHPLILANSKAKRLRSLLARQRALRNEREPFVTALVFTPTDDLPGVPNPSLYRARLRVGGGESDAVGEVDPVRRYERPPRDLVDGDGGLDEFSGEAALHDLDRVNDVPVDCCGRRSVRDEPGDEPVGTAHQATSARCRMLTKRALLWISTMVSSRYRIGSGR
jgi:hypothetical protein